MDTKKELIEQSLHKSKDFVKDIRKYLYEISQQRELSEQEKEFYELTHEIHIKTNDALLLLDSEVYHFKNWQEADAKLN